MIKKLTIALLFFLSFPLVCLAQQTVSLQHIWNGGEWVPWDNTLDLTSAPTVIAYQASSSSSATQYTEGDTDSTITGTAMLGEAPSDTLEALQLDASKHLQVDIAADSVSLATSANQLPDGHNVTVDNANGAAAVNIQDGGNTITVDGTVTANAGTGTFNVQEPLSVDDNGGSLTVDDGGTDLNVEVTEAFLLDSTFTTTFGADAVFGTAGTADADVLSIQGIASMTPVIVGDGGTDLNVEVTEAFALDTTAVSIKNAVEIMDDWDDGNYANVNMNIAGTDVAANSGTNSAQTQRVTIATDDEINDDVDTIAGHSDRTYTYYTANITADGQIIAASTGTKKHKFRYILIINNDDIDATISLGENGDRDNILETMYLPAYGGQVVFPLSGEGMAQPTADTAIELELINAANNYFIFIEYYTE